MDLQEFVKYRKMGGWLQLFIVLTVISLIISVLGIGGVLLTAQTSLQMGAITPASLTLSVISVVVSVALSGATVFFIYRMEKKKAVLFFILSNVVSFVIAVIVQFIPAQDFVKMEVFANANGLDPNAIMANFQGTTMILNQVISYALTIAWLVLWYLYFKKSERFRVFCLSNQEYNEEYIARRRAWEQENGVESEEIPLQQNVGSADGFGRS